MQSIRLWGLVFGFVFGIWMVLFGLVATILLGINYNSIPISDFIYTLFLAWIIGGSGVTLMVIYFKNHKIFHSIDNEPNKE